MFEPKLLIIENYSRKFHMIAVLVHFRNYEFIDYNLSLVLCSIRIFMDVMNLKIF